MESRVASGRLQCADVLRVPASWEAVLRRCEERFPEDTGVPAPDYLAGKMERLRSFRQLVESGEMLGVAEAVARKEYVPSLPTQVMVNKGRSQRKRIIYVFSPRDDLLLKAINMYLQEVATPEVSPVCHSFQPRKGAQTSFRSLLSDAGLAAKCCLHFDVADYFNSIDPAMCLDTLPGTIKQDEPLMHLLACILHRPEVIRKDHVIAWPRKGVMAGTPLSCILSNFYLKDLDEHFRAAGVTYARYSDDIILFVPESNLPYCERLIRDHLAAKGLRINERKSRVALPGEPWEYLGLRYHRGVVDLSHEAQQKFKARVRRLARMHVKSEQPAAAAAFDFIQHLNRRCYGLGADKGRFTWAVWFFPVMNSAATLQSLDAFTQSQIRFAATRTRAGRSRALLPYSTLRTLGYIPLTSAYFAFQRSPQEYAAVLDRRAGLAIQPHPVA